MATQYESITNNMHRELFLLLARLFTPLYEKSPLYLRDEGLMSDEPCINNRLVYGGSTLLTEALRYQARYGSSQQRSMVFGSQKTQLPFNFLLDAGQVITTPLLWWDVGYDSLFIPLSSMEIKGESPVSRNVLPLCGMPLRLHTEHDPVYLSEIASYMSITTYTQLDRTSNKSYKVFYGGRYDNTVNITSEHPLYPVVAPWLIKWYAAHQYMRNCMAFASNLFRACNTLGHIHRLWPDAHMLLKGSLRNEFKANQKKKSPLPDKLLSNLQCNGKDVWGSQFESARVLIEQKIRAMTDRISKDMATAVLLPPADADVLHTLQSSVTLGFHAPEWREQNNVPFFKRFHYCPPS